MIHHRNSSKDLSLELVPCIQEPCLYQPSPPSILDHDRYLGFFEAMKISNCPLIVSTKNYVSYGPLIYAWPAGALYVYNNNRLRELERLNKSFTLLEGL
ncbi:hypothetical protein Scep_025263 [Stephania cephalantha]|uniref:Uncharacterized protein n=1 Tax=Stephania cephalantha TaxID=152367 RepID=A0AAP0HP50_9MAGN